MGQRGKNMEKLKVKHDHTLTDKIKVGIFALFLILPILVFLPNCLYYGFNEHATNTETTTINYKYESNEVNTLDDLVEGNIYFLSSIQLFSTSGDNLTFTVLNSSSIDNFPLNTHFDDLYHDVNSNGFLTFHWSNDDTLNIEFNSATLIYSFLDDNYQYDLIIHNLDFIYTAALYSYFGNNNYLPQFSDYNVIESVSVNTDDTITDKVATAWGKMWETPMLQWTNNNTFKFTINAFVNVFGITQESKMANYLNYLLVITCIYLVFDIVLTLTTKLTHLINANN